MHHLPRLSDERCPVSAEADAASPPPEALAPGDPNTVVPALETPEFHRRLVESTREGIWVADCEGRTLFANPAMARMLGASPRQMIGRSVFDFVAEAGREAVRRRFEEFLRQPEGRQVEERLRRQDGAEVWALVSVSTLRDAKGAPQGLLGIFTNITEWKASQAALRKSEARLQLQIERMPLAHILWSPEFRVLSWNPAAERMFGYTAREALGRHPYELIVSEAVQPEVDRIWRRLLQGDTSAHSVNANVTKDGRTLICEWSNTPIKERDGTVVGVLSMAQDVTERVRAEEALRLARDQLELRVAERTAELLKSHQAVAESEEKYRRLFETISDAALVVEGETRRLVEVNEAALRMYGYSRGEFMGMPLEQITAEPEDTEATIRLALSGAMPRVAVRHHRRKDGTLFPVEIACGTFSLKGRPMVCGVVRDITQRRQAEAELSRREQELSDFFAESPLGLLWVSPEGRILRVNQAELALLERRGDEVMGRPVGELHTPQPGVGDLLRRLARGETVRDYRACVQLPDRPPREVLIDANGLWDGGRLVHSRWFVRDISRSVQLEREILAISEQEQRRLGQDLHDDLCQQLAGIGFLSQRLAGKLENRDSAAAAMAAELSVLVQQTLERTRELARGLSPVRLEAEGLADGLRELAAQTRRVFGVACHFRARGAARLANPSLGTHLYRIAQEAVTNAIKHGAARHIELRLSARGTTLALSVRDDGAGFKPDRRHQTGMGLRIMQYRAEVAGGSLLIQTRKGKGTVVTCRVPGALPAPPRKSAP